MTQLGTARTGEITQAMRTVAQDEAIDLELVRQRVAEGSVVIPASIYHSHLNPCGIGAGLRTKVNANLGTSPDYGSAASELEKLRVALEARADTVMDLSIGGGISEVRRALLSACPVPLGTVPIYEIAIKSIDQRGSIVDMAADDIFQVIEEQAKDGVDFMTVHCGVTISALERLKNQGRVTDVVSRGGSFLMGWILYNERENPLYEEYDRLLEIAHRYDITLSLGDGMRPGSLADATDRAQIEELLTLGELVERAWEAGVQVMVEGPGHLPLDQITANVKLQKQICKGAPFYVLGPLVTDVAAGYDHITAAIGGAVAAASGADFLCYVTPAEHLSLPDLDDVREGIIATRIAGHAADIVKGVKGAKDWDNEMSKARKGLDWQKQAQLSLDSTQASKVHAKHGTSAAGCSMCGKYCAMELVSQYLGSPAEKC